MERLSRDEQLRLVEQTCRGDLDAFARLRQAFHATLVRYISRALPAGEEEAEDLASDVWIRVFDKIGTFDPDRDVAFYTFVIAFSARRLVEDARRRRRKFKAFRQIESEEGSETIEEFPDTRQGGPPDLAVAAEEQQLKSAAFRELFRLTFLCGGYPHEQLAFAFSKHIYGKESPRGIEGAPKRLDEEHGSTPLGEMANRYWQDYEKASTIGDEALLRDLEAQLEPIHHRLSLPVEELLRFDETHDRYGVELLRKRSSESCLREYYAGHEGGSSAAISEWSYRVKEAVRRALGARKEVSSEEAEKDLAGRSLRGPVDPVSCGRCKLRHVPPCSSGEPPAGTGERPTSPPSG
jgi:RNA polymerase sigma factor (sigma-70 family)